MLVVNQIVCPIFVGRRNSGGELDVHGNVLGTAFSIGGGCCLTAGHVVRELEARTANDIGFIATPIEEKWEGSPVLEVETLDADIGVVKCSLANDLLPTLPWNLENLNVLSVVRSMGYAYGTHIVEEERMVIARAFRGEVACTLPRFKPIGLEGPVFSVHELSFQAPRGLSGAPLLDDVQGEVRGIVIGNSHSEMCVSFETEMESDGQSVHSIERVERLTLGVAVRAVEVASLSSALLAGTVGDHLRRQGLLM